MSNAFERLLKRIQQEIVPAHAQLAVRFTRNIDTRLELGVVVDDWTVTELPPPPEPVLTDLTHWHSAKDTLREPGTASAFFQDKSGFVFTEGMPGRVNVWQNDDGGSGGGLFIADVGDGLPGMRMRTGAFNGIQTAVPPAEDAGDLLTVPTQSLSILAADFTIMWRCEISSGATFASIWQTFFGGSERLFVMVISATTAELVTDGADTGSLTIPVAGSRAPFILTLRCVNRIVSLYSGDDFATPVCTGVYPGSGPPTAGFHAMSRVGDGFGTDASRPIDRECLTYNRALTDTELQENFDYLESEWGAL